MLIVAALALTLAERFAEIAKTSGGRLGVCVQAADGGTRQDKLNGAERFPMQSDLGTVISGSTRPPEWTAGWG